MCNSMFLILIIVLSVIFLEHISNIPHEDKRKRSTYTAPVTVVNHGDEDTSEFTRHGNVNPQQSGKPSTHCVSSVCKQLVEMFCISKFENI